jgi:hypothetical protein
MLPPIKRRTLSADDLLAGRGTSSNPPLWAYAKNRPPVDKSEKLFSKKDLGIADKQCRLPKKWV